MLSSGIKRRTRFKLFKQNKGQISSFSLFLLLQGYFPWCLTYFVGYFVHFSQKFCVHFKILHALNTLLDFCQRHFLCLKVLF